MQQPVSLVKATSTTTATGTLATLGYVALRLIMAAHRYGPVADMIDNAADAVQALATLAT